MNEVNNISRSFADNVNYLAELDKQYYTDGFIKRNGIQLGTQEYFGKVTMNVFDKSQKKHIVSDIISGSIVGNSGLEQFLLDMKTSIETLYSDVVVNVVVSDGTGAIVDKNINITLSSTDTIIGLIQFDISMYTNPGIVADYTKYSILSASNEYIAILPYLSTLDNDFNNSILSIGELSDEIVNVSNNSEKINSIVQYIIPHIDEILLSDDMADQAEASAMLAEASKIAASLSAASSLQSSNSASSSAINADNSATSALSSKNNAELAANNAAAIFANIGNAETNAANSAIAASLSAESASESAIVSATKSSEASDSAVNSLSYSNSASTSASSALASKNSASSSEANSLTYKNSASISATTAATSATNASISATQSATSAGESSSSASSASSAAINANDSSISAAISASEALISKNSAISSASSAGVSATNALASEIKAEKWSSEIEDVEVEPGEYSAKHWALKSKKLSVGIASNISYDNTESGLSSSTSQDAIDELDNNLDNLTANVYTKSEVNASLATKVDKVIGKQLSAEDFTTEEKNKLIGIAIGANNYTLPTATSTTNGGVELYSDTVQTVASNAVTNTASRTYGLQFNSAGQAVVNVPWVDTNTVYTHPVSGATAGTYKSITVDINGHVTSGTNPTTIGAFGITDAYTKTQTQETLPSVGFDTSNTTPPTRVGQMKWNENEGTVDLAVYNAVIQIGQEFVVNVRNNTGSTIANGTVVMATGSIGNSGRITIASHDGTIANAVNILGVTTQDIANGADGIVTIMGKVRSLNTTGSTVGETWADGTKLYVKPNDGGRLTSIEPGDFETKMSVAYVVHAHTNGTLYVRTLGFDENNYKIWVQNKLDLKANISSPAFTGTPTAPTPISGNSTTQLATTAFVNAEIQNDSTSLNTANLLVRRDASGNFSAGIITAGLTGNSSTATALQNARTISISGDLTYTSATFNGSSNVTGVGTLANSGVVSGTYRSVTTDSKGRITSGTNPTTVSGYGLTDVYTKTESNSSLALKVNNSEKGIANGIATLDLNGKVVLSQIPDSVLGQLEYMGTWDFTTVLPTATQKGQYWISSISGNGYAVGDWSVWNGTAFDKVDNTDAVSSVAGRTGNVVLAKSDVGLANVDNTTDSSKPVSIAQQNALNLKANLASPVFTGNVTGLGVATGTSFNSITGLSSVVGTTNGTAAVGTSTTVARADHVHPIQTTIAGNAATATALQTSRNIGGVAFNGTSDITLPGVNATGNQATTGNAGTATKLATTRNIALTGDVTGNVDFDGTANVSIAATIAANSVALGTDTTGNYVAGNTAGTGIAVTGTAGEGWSPTIALTNVGTAGTYKSVTTDAQGRITSGTNPTTLSGYGITDAATALRTTATFTTVANTWYRIATSAVGIDRNSAEFVVDWVVSGSHGSTRFAAGCHYGEAAGVSLMQTNYSKYGTLGITEARIVYHTTYSGNYAYVEVKFAGALTNVIVNVEMQDTIGWSLVSPSTAGSVPAGYTSYLHTFVPSASITAGTYPKVTINQEGRVTSGTTLVATDIPVLDASKITTGTLPVTRGGTGVTTSTGTGNVVLSTSPVLTTPSLGAATATSISSTGVIAGGGITSTGNTGFKNDVYVLNSRNPIWSFGNSPTYGISYYQASAGIGNKDTIAFDFGTNTSAAAKFYVTSDGNLSASGSISSNGVVIGTLAEFTAALG